VTDLLKAGIPEPNETAVARERLVYTFPWKPTHVTVATDIPGTGQGEARHRKYKRLKLGGGQGYGRLAD
jgi:hypothetical protein